MTDDNARVKAGNVLDVDRVTLFMAVSICLTLYMFLKFQPRPSQWWMPLAPTIGALLLFGIAFAQEALACESSARKCWDAFVRRERGCRTVQGTITGVDHVTRYYARIELRCPLPGGGFGDLSVTAYEEVLEMFRLSKGPKAQITPQVGQEVQIRYYKSCDVTSEIRFAPDRWTEVRQIRGVHQSLKGGPMTLTVAFIGAGGNLSTQQYTMPTWLAMELKRRHITPTLLDNCTVKLKVPVASDEVVDLQLAAFDEADLADAYAAAFWASTNRLSRQFQDTQAMDPQAEIRVLRSRFWRAMAELPMMAVLALARIELQLCEAELAQRDPEGDPQNEAALLEYRRARRQRRHLLSLWGLERGNMSVIRLLRAQRVLGWEPTLHLRKTPLTSRC